MVLIRDVKDGENVLDLDSDTGYFFVNLHTQNG